MKIPTYLAQGDIPGGFSSRALAVPTAPAMPVVANPLGSGLVASGDAIARAGAAIDAAEAEKRKYQDAADTTAAVTSADDQIAQMEITLKTGRRDPDTGEVIEAPATHKDYFQRWQEGRNAIVQQTLEAMPDATTKMQAAGLINRALIPKQVAARGYANELFKNQLEAQTEQTLSAAANKAVDDPFYESLGLAEAEKMRGFWPADKIASVQQTFQEQVALGRVNKAFKVDPDGTIAALREGQTAIPVDKALKLADTLQARVFAEVRHTEEQTQKQWKMLEEGWHRWQTDQATSDYMAARNKTLSRAQLDQNAIDWHYTPGQYAQILDAYEAAPKQAPSDEATRSRVMISANSMRPDITEAQIKALNRTGLLNDKDTVEAIDKVVARTRQAQEDARSAAAEARTAAGEARTAENQTRSKLGADQAQAEQLLRISVGIPPNIIDMKGLSPEVSQALDQGMQQLTNRSAYFPGGKENPLDVVREIIPEVQKVAKIQGRLNAVTITGLIPDRFKTNGQPDRSKLEAASDLVPNERRRYQELFARLKQINDAGGMVDAQGAATKPPQAPTERRYPAKP